ncbi:MAG TPA: 16S rRNA (adenine(1518)-N(6)/adenine(1519)-N(6))-dimethyltransferase RsmA [Patescibacteria group bacterium]|nr:16S rRNA (adenine(1518)-N(6)/adenine(1519)-N(6))-dimethyltransferase RsmA [Patescibacteria group bacterium]
MIDPADAHQLDSLLRRHRIELDHRLGQNFLTDPALRDAIAKSAELTPDDTVVEVGAGVGTLTIALAPLCREIVAVELDRKLIPALNDVIVGHQNVRVEQADILRFDFASVFPEGGGVVVGNIPYNLTGALVRKLLDPVARPRRLSLVVQKEVADRWTAATGASLATVAVQVFAVPRTVFTIPAAAFTPPPRVDSALVALDVRPQPAVGVRDLDGFFRFVEAVFQFRRKQLGGTMARLSDSAGPEAARVLTELRIDPSRRPQTLSLSEWEVLYERFGQAGSR